MKMQIGENCSFHSRFKCLTICVAHLSFFTLSLLRCFVVFAFTDLAEAAHMAAWHTHSHAPPTEEGCRALCHAPSHPTPWGHRPAPAQLDHPPPGQTWWVDKTKSTSKTKVGRKIVLCSYSNLLHVISIHCTPNYTWKDKHCLFWQLLMWACPDTHISTHTKDEGSEHAVAASQVFHWNATLRYVLIQPAVCANKSVGREWWGRELQVICLPFLFFYPFFTSLPLFFPNLSHILLLHLFPHLSLPLSLSSFLLHPLTVSFPNNLPHFPHLIPWVHSVKTKIHQKFGGIATDATAVCVCACVCVCRQ